MQHEALELLAAPRYISVTLASLCGNQVLGTKTFLFSSVLWRVMIVQITTKKG